MTTLLVLATDPTPKPADVTAGWLAFGIFIALCLATAAICYLMAKQLRKAQQQREDGGFDQPELPGSGIPPTHHSA